MGEAHRDIRPRRRVADTTDVVMSDEIIWVGALEDDDFQRVGGLVGGNELMQFSDCIGIQQVDRGIVEDDAPKGWRILGDGELLRLWHSLLLSFATHVVSTRTRSDETQSRHVDDPMEHEAGFLRSAQAGCW